MHKYLKIKQLFFFLVLALGWYACTDDTSRKDEQAEEKPVETEVVKEEVFDIDSATGLVIDTGFQMVRANCIACHSANLVTQNRASRDGWKEMIRWMQESQNLWDLGPNEELILDYLAKHYAPKMTGRRARLKDIEWYELKD
ncbi:hypothetical protein AAG747_19970 [Rapidithrix thailandica]|uniref:Monoheme cytochrome c n=1 Tax=Rapidithrix thailandica TaxID=413964 RepID=A0AAW9S8J7_9BACT